MTAIFRTAKESLKVTLAIRELWQEKGQTSVVLSALTISVFIVGLLIHVRTALLESINHSLELTHLPTHILETSDFSALSLIDDLEAIPEIEVAEPFIDRRITRMKFEGELWRPLVLYGRADFENLQVAKLQFDQELNQTLLDGQRYQSRCNK